MSVNTKTPAKAAAPAAAKTAVAAAVPAAAPAAPKILLTLGLYQRYSQGGVVYEKGKVYAFDFETGQDKLSEEDTGRPIWRIYKEPKAADAAADKPAIVDMTAVKSAPQGGTATATDKGLELGTAAEEAELGLDKLDGGAPAGAGTEVGSVETTGTTGDTSGAVSL